MRATTLAPQVYVPPQPVGIGFTIASYITLALLLIIALIITIPAGWYVVRTVITRVSSLLERQLESDKRQAESNKAMRAAAARNAIVSKRGGPSSAVGTSLGGGGGPPGGGALSFVKDL